MRPLPLLLALGHMGLLWWLSSQPATGMGLPHPWDKGAHFLAYLFLGLLLRLGLGRFLPAFLLAALYGAVEEWRQGFVPGRERDPWDLLADALGAWVGARLGGRWEAPEAFRP
ncbi:VanZ family protein [Thermus tengchongensis]|uniref:VanZ family protein n=1 Tax=Thermus tengchongensis TaxID=1214928 RepID=UPI001F3FB7CC|nr:VanZ family protein [Thermus tengchongensis]